MVHKVRDTFAWKLIEVKTLWGRGRGEKAMRTTTCNQVWCQPSHNSKQTVAENSLMLSLLIFFNQCLLLIIKEKFLFIAIGLYCCTQSSTFISKGWIFLIEVNTNQVILSANQECRLLCLLADTVSKISRGWLLAVVFNEFAPYPSPIVLALARLNLLHYKP